MSGAASAGDDRFDLRIAQEGGTWGYVPDEASQAMMTRIYGSAGNGAPLGDLFAGFGDEAAFNGSVVLNNALAGGYNPDAIAGVLADALGTSEQRANVIARNEMLGAYRDAQLENFRANSDVVRGWMWSAADGCCVACAFMDGSMHTLDEDMDSHVGCRCSPLPATFSYEDLLGDLGIDVSDIADTSIDIGYEPMMTRLATDPDGMRELLGPSKFNAWARGDVKIADLVGVRDDGEWGLSIYEKSLKELGLDASDYLGADAEPTEVDIYNRTVNQQCMTCNKVIRGPLEGIQFTEQIQFSGGEGWSHGVCPDCKANFVRSYFEKRYPEATADEIDQMVYLKTRNPDATIEEIEQMTEERMASPALGSQEGAAGAEIGPASPMRDRSSLPEMAPRQLADKQATDVTKRIERDMYKGLKGDGSQADFQKVRDDVSSRLAKKLDSDPAWQTMQSRLASADKSSRERVADLLKVWQNGFKLDAGAEKYTLDALRVAAAQEFGIDPAAMGYTPQQLGAIEKTWGEYHIPAYRSFLRAQYEQTQAWFQERGITSVRMYRGQAWPASRAPGVLNFAGDGQIISPQLSPLSAWSSSPAAAYNFATDSFTTTSLGEARAVMSADVPVERILSIPRTGMGNIYESEMVLIGGNNSGSAAVFSWNGGADLRAVEAGLANARDAAPRAPVLGNVRVPVDVSKITKPIAPDSVQRILDVIPEDGVRTHNEALQLGRTINDEIQAHIVEGLADAARAAQDIYLKGVEDLTDAEKAWVGYGKSEPYGGFKFGSVQQQYSAAVREVTRNLLEQVRELAGDLAPNIDVAGNAAHDERVAQALRDAVQQLPRDWIATNNESFDMQMVRDRTRDATAGWYQPADGRLAIRYTKDSDAAALRTTALHEFMHRLEQVYPNISDLEGAFYEARTAGEVFVDLTNGIQDTTKLDQWVDEYVGRRPMIIYGSYDPQTRAYAYSYEILSIGVEYLLGETGNAALLASDPEWMRFVLGILFGV